MQIDSEIVVFFIGLFFALVGYVTISISAKITAMESDIKTMLVNHTERICVLETRSNIR